MVGKVLVFLAGVADLGNSLYDPLRTREGEKFFLPFLEVVLPVGVLGFESGFDGGEGVLDPGDFFFIGIGVDRDG